MWERCESRGVVETGPPAMGRGRRMPLQRTLRPYGTDVSVMETASMAATIRSVQNSRNRPEAEPNSRRAREAHNSHDHTSNEHEQLTITILGRVWQPGWRRKRQVGLTGKGTWTGTHSATYAIPSGPVASGEVSIQSPTWPRWPPGQAGQLSDQPRRHQPSAAIHTLRRMYGARHLTQLREIPVGMAAATSVGSRTARTVPCRTVPYRTDPDSHSHSHSPPRSKIRSKRLPLPLPLPFPLHRRRHCLNAIAPSGSHSTPLPPCRWSVPTEHRSGRSERASGLHVYST